MDDNSFMIIQGSSCVSFAVSPGNVDLLITSVNGSRPIQATGPDILTAVLLGFRRASEEVLDETLVAAGCQDRFNKAPVLARLGHYLTTPYACIRGTGTGDDPYHLGRRDWFERSPVLDSTSTQPELFAAAAVFATRQYNNEILSDAYRRLRQPEASAVPTLIVPSRAPSHSLR